MTEGKLRMTKDKLRVTKEEARNDRARRLRVTTGRSLPAPCSGLSDSPTLHYFKLTAVTAPDAISTSIFFFPTLVSLRRSRNWSGLIFVRSSMVAVFP